MLPKVSIIVPIYNVEKYLTRCLDSLINQTYTNIEIILINDGSLDKSDEIAMNYVNLDKRIKLFNQSNQGQAKARNVGISKSTGDYIMFVDSDDWLDTSCISCCVDEILKKDADLVIFDMNLIKKNATYYLSYDLSIYGSHSGPCNKLYSKKLWVDKYFPIGVWYEDLGIMPIIVKNARNKVKINKALYNYDFTRESSQSHQIQENKIRDILKMLDLVYLELVDYQKKDELEYLFIQHILGGAVYRKALLIKDKNVRKEIIDESMEYLEDKFPSWIMNGHFRSNNNLVSIIERKLAYFIINKKYSTITIIWNLLNSIRRIK
ncbi:glycosyltransferase family 2 protein [Gottfriedia sp. NPDC057948]|uniref:glycosyltransferase family 2 protein n=1 Tax=Gottfriedia sp. NPDC057948 TaxID=3346287 RepID=UPI0036DF6CDA